MNKNIIKKALCYIVTLCLVFGSVAVMPTYAAVPTMNVDADKAKLFEIIDNINENGNRHAIASLIKLYVGGTNPTHDYAADIHAAIHYSDLSISSVQTTLAGIKAIHEIKPTFVVQALAKLENGFTAYSAPAAPNNFPTIQTIIINNAKSLKVFMNTLEQIKTFNNGAIFLKSQSSTISYTSSFSTMFTTLLSFTENQSVIDRANAYKSVLDTLIQQVNAANSSDKTAFINYLKDQNFLTVVSVQDDDDDDTPSTGGSGGGGGGGTTTPSTGTTTPTVTPATATEPVTVKVPAPTVNTAGQAKVQITAQTLQSAFTAAKQDAQGIKQIKIEVPATTGAKSYAVAIPSEALIKSAVTENIQIKTSLGTVELPSNMLVANSVETGKTVELVIAKADTTALSAELQAKIGTRPIIELNILVGGVKKEWTSDTAKVKVSLDYKPTAEELANPESIVVYYIDGKGKVVEVPNGRYDVKTGKVVFEVTHFSLYAVSYVKKAYTDIDKYLWAKKHIEVMTAKGIIKEVNSTTFNPAGNITRAEFIYGLVNSLGLDAKIDANFTDVNATDYYYDALAIAKKLGVVNGVGNNKFLPTTDISRQEMMVMTVRALKIVNKINTANVADLSKYIDNAKIASFAKADVANLVAENLIEGNGKSVNPLGNVTRAEGAVVLYRVYNK